MSRSVFSPRRGKHGAADIDPDHISAGSCHARKYGRINAVPASDLKDRGARPDSHFFITAVFTILKKRHRMDEVEVGHKEFASPAASTPANPEANESMVFTNFF